MIGMLRDIFIGVLYLFGIGFFGFFAMFLFAMIIRMLREWRDD